MGKTLLFQGDSITDCGRITSGGAGYPVDLWGPGYAGLIATELMGEQPEKDWNIINRGISGNRVVDLYARWKIDALNLKPDIISILIGVNDTWHEKNRENGVEVPRYERIYREILTWTRKVLPQVKFILMEPYVFPFGAADETWVEEVTARGDVVRRLAEEFDAVFVPLQSVFQEATKRAPIEYWLRDGVHPLPAGHQLIKKAWMEAFATLA